MKYTPEKIKKKNLKIPGVSAPHKQDDKRIAQVRADVQTQPKLQKIILIGITKRMIITRDSSSSGAQEN